MKAHIVIAPVMALMVASMAFHITPEQSTAKTEVVAETPAKTGIQFFEGTFEEAKAAAKKEGKLIFVDAYAVWCGPCKFMAAKVFTNEEVGEFFNKNFINVKMDMERGEGTSYSRSWGIRAYPTLLIFDAKGKEVKRKLGGMDAKSFVNWGNSVL